MHGRHSNGQNNSSAIFKYFQFWWAISALTLRDMGFLIPKISFYIPNILTSPGNVLPTPGYFVNLDLYSL